MDLRIEKDRGFDKISQYGWVNIEIGDTRIGKARISCTRKKLIINSINIFPEFERNGYAREVINRFKEDYEKIIADRVRNRAIGFWQKMGFIDNKDGNFIWRKSNSKRAALSARS